MKEDSFCPIATYKRQTLEPKFELIRTAELCLVGRSAFHWQKFYGRRVPEDAPIILERRHGCFGRHGCFVGA